MQFSFALDPRSTLFLDFDGTLVGIAQTPEAVYVEPGLTDLLARLAAALDGAVALVSGRPLEQLDRYLAPLRLPAAGVHGAERRRPDGVVERRALPALERVADVALRLAAEHPGLLVERKISAVALHYRGAPHQEAACRAAMQQAVAGDSGLHLMHGKMVIEALPHGVGKGHAVDAFLREPPFAGRRPIFIGDDVTDEAGFEAVQRAGGVAARVGPGQSIATHQLATPAAVRHWLARQLDTLTATAH
jgi:trehalose 6-phosphate phosphatase